MSNLSSRLGSLSREEKAQLAQLLRKKKEAAAPPAPAAVPRDERRELPLSFAQQRLWFLDRLAPGNPFYNVTGAARILGRLDVTAMAASLSEIVRRHEVLRTRFEIRGQGPVQIVEPPAPLPLPVIDLSALPQEIRGAEEDRVVRAEHLTPFDLARPPFFRAHLLRFGPEEHLLVDVFHHIASDAWSLELAIGEVAALYPAFLRRRPSPLPELPLQYADFAWEQVHTLQGEAVTREVDFWRQRLAGAPPLDLPTDHPRPAVPTFRGGEVRKMLDPSLYDSLKLLVPRERVTLFMAVLAPVCAFLARIAAIEDVVVGTTVAGRNRQDLMGLIGFFINTLVLRIGLDGDPDGGQILARTRETVLDAFGHQDLPFEKLVDELGLPRDPYRPPLLRAFFQYIPARPQSPADEDTGFVLEPYRLANDTAKFDLGINVFEFGPDLLVDWRYDADLFERDTIVRWSGAFERLLEAWLEDPARRLSELPVLTPAERYQLLEEWNAAPVQSVCPQESRRALPALFEEQVDRTPDAPAVSERNGLSVTYRELDERASRLARWLRDTGVVPGDRVALCLDRSVDLVASLLGVLKTGAAYVPLDPASPRERLAFALEDSGAALVLTTGTLVGALPEGRTRALLLDREADAIARQSGARPGLEIDRELPAYVIYTSGSTGRPKGVVVPHGNVSRLFSATDPWFGFSSEDVWTLFHSYAFDFSVWEIWGALLYGGRLVVVPYWESREPEAFWRLLREEGVTVLNQTPSAFRQLMWAEEPSPPAPLPQAGEGCGLEGLQVCGSATNLHPSPACGRGAGGEGLPLRYVLFGGEALDPAMLAPWFQRHGDVRPQLVNLYGITETTVHVTYRPLTREDASRPGSRIGVPIPDLTLHVLDPHLQLQPVGTPGEICVGGEGLAHGYLDRPDLTAARFVPDPFGDLSGRSGARLYRSGDLARRRPDGDVEYLGRIDHQVKIRGFRIELGEIEAAIAAHPAVREAVVLASGDRLAAYITAPEEAPSLAGLREFLAGRLPDYMFPSALVVLDQLPLTSNGKVDRRALPSPDAAPAVASGREHIPPRDALETEIAERFRQVLSLPAERQIGVLDDFFELGGSSISGAVLVNGLQERLGEIVHVVTIFDHPTVAALAGYVREQHPAATDRLWGAGLASGAEVAEAPPAGPAEVEEMLRLITEGRPEASQEDETGEPLNPPAVFLLSPPRSGSTLLRVLLGGHPRLFAPPELELLSFRTLAGRQAAFAGRDSFWLEGTVRAVMEARQCDLAEAERILAAGAAEGWTTRRLYREIQGWISDRLGGRLLVDKTPSYALDPAVLRRAEQWFAEPRYIHLLRHPQATNRSFEEARLDQIFFRRPHRFPRRQLAELIWTVSHRHILDFLAEVPAERRMTVRFEDLVRDPAAVLAGICAFLGLPYDPAMADPYRGGSARMTDGVHAVSRMLGDVKFHAHGKVDAAVAERWREAGEAPLAPLGDPAREVAAHLGYDVREARAGSAWEAGGTAPLSFAQERLWLLEQLIPGTPTYNIPSGLRLHGRLDVPALARVVAEIVRRHAALRTVFTTEGGEPVQRILPARPPAPGSPGWFPVVDLETLPGALRDPEVGRLASAQATRPFDLERGPLFRTCLLRLGSTEHVAVYTMHHIVSDGWSMGIFYGEVAALYEAFAAGRPSPLPELTLQYPDFALRQRDGRGQERLARELEHWTERLAGIEPLELPTDRPRPPVRSGRGAIARLAFRPGLAAELTALARGKQATLYMVLLAAFQTLLHRFTQQDDIAVGSPVANRSERDVEALIGFFVNTLVMRTDLSGDPSFFDLLARVRRTALDALRHQGAPFERVVEAVQPERQLGRTPLFQVMFSLQSSRGVGAGTDTTTQLPDLVLEGVEAISATSKFDLTVLFGELATGLGASLEYDVDLFEAATAGRLARHLETLLEGVLADPGARLSALPLLDEAERRQILTAWNRTEVPFPRETPIHRLVLEQAARTPDAVALSSDEGDLTYAALVAAAGRLARRLRHRGAGPEVPVVVLAERSPALVTALLAVLESGSFFLPLDPAHPRERLAALAAAVGARLAVTQERFLDLLPDGIDAICLESLSHPAEEGEIYIDGGATAANLMYVMFTSGSTGEPKGVAVTHRNVARLTQGSDFARFGPGETFLLLAPVSFDASTLEIWGPLTNGGRLAIFPPHTPALDELAAFLERQGVTQLWLTAGLFHSMADERLDGFAPLRRLLTGGDVIAPAPVRRVLERHPELVVVNGYGPTEGTTFTTCHVLTAPDHVGDSLPIGRPIANTRVHVLEPGLEPSPIGVWGELHAGGEGLARGYFGRPDLTAERFVPDPYGPPGARLYRTGDLARRQPDGVLEFLGRRDRQVKIRGFRIELAEIEASLAAHPQVREAAILVRQEDGDKRLVAYVASDDEADLRSWLAARLPEPMIPAAFVLLPRLPLTPNGKVDRRELAKIAPERSESGAGYVAPRTPLEEALAGIFLQVLGTERTGGRVGVGDDFFELGGHSLAATRLVSRIQAELGVELPLRALFEAPTVAALAARCGAPSPAPDSTAVDLVVDLVGGPRDPAGEPLSFAQERLWFLEQLTPGTSTLNLPSRARLRGPLDPALLALCFAELRRRHEALRTRFTLRGDTPVQVVDPPAPFVLPLVDLTSLPQEVRGAEAERQAGEEADQPFDLQRGPLLRAVLLRLGAEEHGLLLSVHHVVTDGWSMGILFREVAALYAAFAEGRPSPLPELPVQIADVARWQRARLQGPLLESQLAWWRERLGGAPAALDLPLDRVRPPVQTFRGASVVRLLPADLASHLHSLARRENASLFMVLLAGLDLLLARWSGQDDILVGTPVAGRNRPELEDLIGLFLNTLVLRVDLSGSASGPVSGQLTGRELLVRAREAALGAYAHQEIPFERLLEDLQPERDLSRTPLFQVFLNMLNFPDAGARLPSGLVLEPLGGTGVDSKFDLTIYAAEVPEGISLSLVYNEDLFDRGRMEELLCQLQGVLDQLALAPEVPVEAISLRTPEAAALLPDPRQPLGDAWAGAVHALFAEQARLHPERPAVSDPEGTWTYGELAEAVARLAARLRADGLESGEPVAIWAHRSAPAAWAVFGALWAGGSFVLLDPAYPPARLAEIVALAAPRYWLDIAAAGPPPAEVEEALAAAGTLRGRLRLPGGGPEGARTLLNHLPAPIEPAEAGPEDVVAIAFTSGSTGTPKGILQLHGSMSHFLPFLAERFGIGPEDRFSLLSGLSHDPFQRDLFTSLCLGASLCVPTAEEIGAPGALAAWMARQRITVSNLTPAMAQLLTETAGGAPPVLPDLRAAFLIGDVLTRADAARLRRLAPGVLCVNLYGTTETQRALAMHLVTAAEITDPRAPQVLPLGRGMRDAQLVIAAAGPAGPPRAAGIGELGEIWVRSPHLARGYLADEALTADRFRINPFSGDRSDRIYRTGDLGRYRPDGEVTFAGRADLQLKVRSFRIEPAEIEAALGRLPGVREAVVLPRETGRPGDRELVAYVAGDGGDPAQWREGLRSRLPTYMVPAAFVRLTELPLTPNGKVDRRALARIEPDHSREGATFVAPEGPVEELLAEAWRDLLGVTRVGAHDNFFDLGGHSLLASRLLVRVQALLGIELPLRRIFERPVLRDLAQEIAALRAAGTGEAVPPLRRVLRDRALPLSFQQERLWFIDQLDPGLPAYNIASAVRLSGRLEIPALAASLSDIVRRHEVLRTTYGSPAEGPLQTVHPAAPIPLPVLDLGGLPEPRREEEAARLARAEAAHPFDLVRGPVLRVTLLRLAAAEHVALMTFHHIATDGWSVGVFQSELAALYATLCARHSSSLAPLSELPELPVQYADYAVWQREWLTGDRLEAQVRHWRGALAGLPELLELPTDRPRPAIQSVRGGKRDASLRPDLAAGLERLSRQHGATLFMTLAAGWATLLHRWSGREDIPLGTPVANRSRSEVEGLIGFFTNTLVLRVDLAGAPSFGELMARVREASLDAFSHQDVPFEKLVEELAPRRSLSYPPLFQVFFALQNMPLASVDAAELRLSPVEADSGASQFDLGLALVPGPEGVGGKLTYVRDLFAAATIDRLLGHFRMLLAAVVEDAGTRIGEIPLLSPEERGQLAEWNRTGAEIPPVGAHELIAAQAARTPDAVAVEDLNGGRLTYRALDEKAERLALSLERLGVGPEVLVGIALERSLDLPVALLAVLKAGGGYVPLDPDLPPERLAWMLEDSGLQVLLTQERLLPLFSGGSADRRTVLLDRHDPFGAAVRPRRRTCLPEQTAYVLYTSGSTGRPKGVQVPHAALVNFLLSMSRRPGLGPDDTLLAITTLSFDIAGLELYLPLVVGARVRIASREVAADGLLLAQALMASEVTALQATPATWRLLFAAGWTGKPGLLALCGGEALPRDLAGRLLEATGALWNVYGPTETTIWSTVEEIRELKGPVSIGRPVANTRIEVLSPALEPLPVGAPGELCIAGAGLARGYLHRPDLTADRFIPNPAGARLYRTGDLARWLPDGRLEHLGRIDTQVKIRGFRIELGEIEAELGRLPGVREAVVLARETGPDDRHLAAYVVADPAAGEIAPERLREGLRARLPVYMVPSAFVFLDQLPLTPSRKVDRRALAQIAPERTGAQGEDGDLAPRTPVEETLASLFVEVLGIERTGGRVGVRQSFFELGGHSLLATRLMAAIREAFRIELPLRLLFEKPTVEQLAGAISEAGEGGMTAEEPVVRQPRQQDGPSRFPVSFSQLREWILDRLEPGNPAYNLQSHLRIEGPLSVPVLLGALDGLVRRHEVFRTGFLAGGFLAGEEEPLQVVLPEVDLRVPVIDLAALPEEAREAELQRRVRQEARTGFDLSAAPLLRARLVRLGPADHGLLMTVHHIIADGWSIGILNQELAALYEAGAAGTPSPLPPLPVQYADYAVWLRGRLSGANLERHVDYWRQRLTGAPPLLELPTDRPRPAVRSSRGARLPFQLPQPLSGRLGELAVRHGGTAFMVLLAAYQTLLARWSGQDDIVVGTYSGNRPRRELEGLIGFLVNTLVLRSDLSTDPSFAGLIGRVRETTLGAYAHRDLPFEKLLEILQLARDPSRTPLFQALLVLHNFPPARADLSPGVRLSGLGAAGEQADYDLSLWLGEGANGLGGYFEYSTDLFDEATIVRFGDQLRTLLEAAVADPGRNVWALPLIGEEERARQLEAWSRGPAVPEGAALLHRLVEEQAARTPEAVALEAGTVRLTYAELMERARHEANRLQEAGVGPGSIVALAAERSPELIVRMLAVLQAGAAYLPIDPAYPEERRAYMLQDSGALDPHPPAPSPTRTHARPGEGEPLPEAPNHQGEGVPPRPGGCECGWERGPGGEGHSGGGSDAAYVIYTSGSTGQPKGVVVPHRAITAFVRGARDSYNLGSGDRVLQFASISFDTSAEEIWPALASGATLVLRPDDMAASIPHFLRELERLGITCLDLPTAFWHELASGMDAEGLEMPRGLRLVILGGEEALADRLALWQRRVGPSVRLVNTYGPTETTIVATRRELSALTGSLVPIGRPIAGARTYLLDRLFEPVPPGVRGELWIGGSGVARGYLGRPELTAERFVPDPFGGEPGARLYRTGDLAVLRPDGDLVFAGRADRQLKVRGYRIEPGEIEAALRLHPALRDAVVDARGPGDAKRILAWIVPREGMEAPGASDLRAFLRDMLPEPLLPAAFVPVDNLPLTPSGKVDRRALPEPVETRPDNVAYAEPQSALERTVAEIYRDLLRVARVGLHDNFFDLGGHSLLIVRAHQKLKEALGKEIAVLDLFRFPTVAALARHLGGEETGNLQKVQGLAEQQRAAQQRQKQAMERLRRPGGPVRK